MIGARATNSERYEVDRAARNTRNIEKHADLVTAIDGMLKSPKNGLPFLSYGRYYRLPNEAKSTYLMVDGSIITLAHEVYIEGYKPEISRWLNRPCNVQGWYTHDSNKINAPGSHYVWFEHVIDAVHFKLRWF
jgi:hypothetical protein